jgi:hypothetical protein
MPVAYQIRVYSPTGELQAVTDRFRALTIEHRTNIASTLTLSMYGLENIIQHFVLDAIVEVRRTFPEAGLDWYTEYVGFHRTPQQQITTGDSRIYTSYSRGLLDLINRRSVRYYADTEGSAKGPGAADDIIKQYVRENAGPLATVGNGRLSDGITPGLTIAPDLSEAPVYEGAHAWKNLLEAIKDIGEPHNVDYDVVWLGGASFEFRTYWPQKGTDRSAGQPDAVVFGATQGNFSNPSHTISRTDEVTSVLVLGPGEGPLRDTTLVNAPVTTINESPYNLIEQDQNASQEDRLNALIAIGNEVLYEKRAALNFTFDPIQTPFSSYGKHYFLGDIVTSMMLGFQFNVKIEAVTVNVSDNAERITFELQEQTDQFAGVP